MSWWIICGWFLTIWGACLFIDLCVQLRDVWRTRQLINGPVSDHWHGYNIDGEDELIRWQK